MAKTVGGVLFALVSVITFAGSRPAEGYDQPLECPDGMVSVEGNYCPWLEQPCLRWLDRETERCAEFGPSRCQSQATHKRFCMDRFEYPNREGEKPVVSKTWYAAHDACAADGKRLCGESEWTLACEGEERVPYPYGYARDPLACNIDKELPVPAASPHNLARAHWRSPVDQRESSGARSACVSPFGVHDLTGNVDEWVVAEDGRPRQSALKGGYWGPVRNRCRAVTRAHSENFSFYQIGFRCCL
jgi:formylglycine-generating enzyme